MKKETQTKAIAATLAGLVVAIGPILISLVSGVDVTPDQFEGLKTAANLFFLALSGGLVSWVTVYFAPRNKPIVDE